MNDFTTILILIVVWGAGLLFTSVRKVSYLRSIRDHLAPGAAYSDTMKLGWSRRGFSFSKIDPERLTETGRIYLTRAIVNGRIMVAWLFGGFLVFACLFPHGKGSGPLN